MRYSGRTSTAVAVLALASLSGCAPANSNSNTVPAMPWRFEVAPAFADEFNVDGPIDPTTWELGQFATDQTQYTNRTANVRADGGNLILEARREDLNGSPYTSGLLVSKSKFQYGKFEARIKFPTAAGVFPAFWLWGGGKTTDPAWPGEIDIVEYFSHGGGPNDPDYELASSNLHSTPDPLSDSSRGRFRQLQFDPTAWHVFTGEWAPGEIRTYVDGRLIARYRQSDPESALGGWPFDTYPEAIWLNLNTGASAGPVDDGAMPQRMLVDWVRVYALAGPASSAVTLAP